MAEVTHPALLWEARYHAETGALRDANARLAQRIDKMEKALYATRTRLLRLKLGLVSDEQKAKLIALLEEALTVDTLVTDPVTVAAMEILDRAYQEIEARITLEKEEENHAEK
jgi:hypothetical protein